MSNSLTLSPHVQMLSAKAFGNISPPKTFLENATVRGRAWYKLSDAPVLTLDVMVWHMQMLSSKAFGNMSTRLAWATIFAVALSSVFNVYALRVVRSPSPFQSRPGGNPGANLKSVSHRCHLPREVACE